MRNRVTGPAGEVSGLFYARRPEQLGMKRLELVELWEEDETLHAFPDRPVCVLGGIAFTWTDQFEAQLCQYLDRSRMESILGVEEDSLDSDGWISAPSLSHFQYPKFPEFNEGCLDPRITAREGVSFTKFHVKSCMAESVHLLCQGINFWIICDSIGGTRQLMKQLKTTEDLLRLLKGEKSRLFTNCFFHVQRPGEAVCLPGGKGHCVLHLPDRRTWWCVSMQLEGIRSDVPTKSRDLRLYFSSGKRRDAPRASQEELAQGESQFARLSRAGAGGRGVRSPARRAAGVAKRGRGRPRKRVYTRDSGGARFAKASDST